MARGARLGRTPPAGRALVIDYELVPIDFSDELVRRLGLTGLEVDYGLISHGSRARISRNIACWSCWPRRERSVSGLQLSEAEIPAVAEFVRKGGLLVLGVPSDPEASGQLSPYNDLLSRLGSGIPIQPAIVDDDSARFRGAMFPGSYFEPGRLVLDRATILETHPPAEVRAKSSAAAFAILDWVVRGWKIWRIRAAIPWWRWRAAAPAGCR